VTSTNVPTVRERRPGLLALSREDALSLFVFFVPGHAGAAAITALMLLGTITGVVGGILILIWAVVASFFVCLWSYHWIEERRRRERATTLVLTEMPRLVSKLVSLYSRSAYSPDEAQRVTGVSALYQRAQHALEAEDHRRAGEIIELAIALADELLEKSKEGPSTSPTGPCALCEDARGKAE
jgi:hypothetical protein